jgi:type III secretion protein T
MANLSWEQWILGFSLTLPRLMAAFVLLPFFNTQVIPGMLRNGVAVGLGLAMVPYVALEASAAHLSGITTALLVGKEVIVGMLIGYPMAAAFWGMEAIGFYIDNQRGSAMASSADPLTGQDATPLGILYTQAFTAYFMASGAFMLLLGLLYQTYRIWPVTTFMPAFGAGGPTFYLGVLDHMTGLVVLLSAPIIVAMFLAEFALALVSRFAPQLNVFFLAMPIKSAFAVFMLIFYGPILFGNLLSFDGGVQGIWRAVQAVLP